jgi:hypothetical protein
MPVSADFSAKFTISDAALMSGTGRVRRRDIRAIEEWGQRHQAELYLNCRLAQAGEPPQKIED